MATVRLLLKTKPKSKTGLYPLIFLIQQGGEKKQLHSGYKIESRQWNGSAVVKHPDSVVINSELETRLGKYREKLHDSLITGRKINLDLINQEKQSYSFTGYLGERVRDYEARDKPIMARKTKRLIKEVSECFGEIYFEDVDTDWIRKWDAWLINKKNVTNTRFKKLKCLKQFFRSAINEGKAHAPNPFDLYKIHPEPVKKEKLSITQIKAIEKLKLKESVALARDLFLFSFYSKGMRFENVVTIKKDDIRNGRIYWQSNKGKKWLSVELHPKLEKIVNSNSSKDYLFGLLKQEPDKWKLKRKVESLNAVVNRDLKIIGALLGISDLTFHMARHSFAFALKQTSQNIHVIKDALGHSDSRTTEIYLRALDDEFLDPEVAKVYNY